MYIYAIMINSGGVTHFQRLPLQPNAVDSAAHPTHVVPIKTVPCSAQRSQHSDSQAIFTIFPIFCATLTVYTGRYRPAKQLPQVANASNAKNKTTRPFEAPRHAPARRPKRSDIPRHCFSCLRIWVPLEVGSRLTQAELAQRQPNLKRAQLCCKGTLNSDMTNQVEHLTTQLRQVLRSQRRRWTRKFEQD